jgi:thiamine kinase-like enzyme
LTLVHADFHDEQFHVHAGKGYVIDWDFAHYGSFYIDLANYFTREQALFYRDALAELGYDIPPAEFLARYDAVRPYVGLKYFLIGLWNWRNGEPTQRREQIHYWINLVLNQEQRSLM